MLVVVVGSTLLVLAAVGTSLRRATRRQRWLVATAAGLCLASLWASGTHPPQSPWLNLPVIGGATIASTAVAAFGPFQPRPGLAFIASLAAAAMGLFLGMIVAIEAGWLRP